MHACRSAASSIAIHCSGCGTRHDEAAWGALAVTERIEAPELRQLVSNWPDRLCVEVRRCGCGRTIAAKRPARSP